MNELSSVSPKKDFADPVETTAVVVQQAADPKVGFGVFRKALSLSLSAGYARRSVRAPFLKEQGARDRDRDDGNERNTPQVHARLR